MVFRQLFDSESSTYTYLLGDEESREAILIDPVREHMDRDLKLIEELGLKLKYVLDTHVHADHITAAGAMVERLGVVSVAGEKGAECAGMRVGQGTKLKFGNHEVEVLETPGHTDDSLSYLVGDRVFTGDALLIRGCGRTDFQNGDSGQLYESITNVLLKLPPKTKIYPGHDYKGMSVSTVEEELNFNPRIAGKSKAEFVDLMNNLKLGLPKKIMEAVPANRQCGLPAPPQA